jgi:hypothetical protein
MSEETKLQMLDMLMSGLLSQSLAVVAELGVADELAGGPKTAEELAAKFNVHAGNLHRLLRYTASHGVFRDRGEGYFELTPLAEFLRSDSRQTVPYFDTLVSESRDR